MVTIKAWEVLVSLRTQKGQAAFGGILSSLSRKGRHHISRVRCDHSFYDSSNGTDGFKLVSGPGHGNLNQSWLFRTKMSTLLIWCRKLRECCIGSCTLVTFWPVLRSQLTYSSSNSKRLGWNSVLLMQHQSHICAFYTWHCFFVE